MIDVDLTGPQLNQEQQRVIVQPPPINRIQPASQETLPAHTIILEGREFTLPAIDDIDNEFKNPASEYYQPFQRSSYDSSLRSLYDYMSETADLDLDFQSERYQEINKIMEMMLEGTGKSARAVIMRKGDVGAFAAPDNTFFISQSILNKCESLDEVGAILAYELTHIINSDNRLYNIVNSDATQILGFRWVREFAGDVNAVFLLEKAGLSTKATSSLLNKLTGNTDYEHQPLGMRSAMVTLGHHGINFRTSNKPFTPLSEIPGEWHSQEPTKLTNKEMAAIALNAKPPDKAFLDAILPKLHQKDLQHFAGQVTPEIVFSLFQSRLQEAGFSSNDIQMYSILRAKTIHSPEDLRDIADKLPAFIQSNSYFLMQRELFNYVDILSGFEDFLSKSYFDILNKHLEDAGTFSMSLESLASQVKLPIDQETFFYFIQKMNTEDIHMSDESKSIYITRAVERYLFTNFITKNEQGTRSLQMNNIRKFLTRVVQYKLPFRMDTMRADFETKGYESAYSDDKLQPQLYKLMDTMCMIFYGNRVEEYQTDLPTNEVFEKLTRRTLTHSEKNARLDTFLKQIKHKFRRENTPLPEQEQFIHEIMNRFIESGISEDTLYDAAPDVSVFEVGAWDNVEQLNTKRQEAKNNERHQLSLKNTEISRYFLLEKIARTLYRTDSPAFFQDMATLMTASQVNTNNLSRVELYQLVKPLINSDEHFYWSENRLVKSSNYNSLIQLPFLQSLLEKETHPPTDSIKNLTKYLEILKNQSGGTEIVLFSDSFAQLLLGEGVQEAYWKILQKGIPPNEQQDHYAFIDTYYPDDARKQDILKAIGKHVLESNEMDLPHKIAFLKKHMVSLGYEGLVTVAKQTHTMDEFEFFYNECENAIYTLTQPNNEQIIGISRAANKPEITSDYMKALDTCIATPSEKFTQTSYLALDWFKDIAEERAKIIDGKVLLSSGRDTFKSLRDMIELKKSMKPEQKRYVAGSILTKDGGLLRSKEGKQHLSDKLTTALEAEGFLAHGLRAGCTKVDTDILAVYASEIISGLLYESYDINTIDLNWLYYQLQTDPQLTSFRSLTPEQMVGMLHAPTADIVAFGANYTTPALQNLFDRSQTVKTYYYGIYNYLENKYPLDSGETKPEKKPDVPLNKAAEAIIEGIEAGPVLGPRGLQLVSKFYYFDNQAVNRRLSESFDNNPGLDALLFRLNLRKLAKDGERDPEYKFYTDFLRGSFNDPQCTSEYIFESFGDIIAAGSQFTTMAVTVRNRKGEQLECVLKELAPNAAMHLKESYDAGQAIMDDISDSGSEQESYDAAIGKMILETTQSWCINDMNDVNFEEDDKKFRATVIQGYNAHRKRLTHVEAPALYFSRYHLQLEHKVTQGTTLNRMLKDPEISWIKKASRIYDATDFFAYQLFNAPPIEQIDGEDIYYVQSDWSPGNYMVDPKNKVINMLDRRMYLKLTTKQMEAARALFNGNNTEFYLSFMQAIASENEIRNPKEKLRLVNNIIHKVGLKNGLRAMDLFADETREEKIQAATRSLFTLPKLLQALPSLRKLLDEFPTKPERQEAVKTLNKIRVILNRMQSRQGKLQPLQLLQQVNEELHQQKKSISLGLQLAFLQTMAMKELARRYDKTRMDYRREEDEDQEEAA